MMDARAIDMSAHQKDVNYKALKQTGVQYAVVKCSEGYNLSGAWPDHLNGCVTAGIPCGVYSYVVADNVTEAKKHAEFLVGRLNLQKGKISLPVFADMEDPKYDSAKYSKELKTSILLAFLDVIKRSGYYAAVYINPSWLEHKIDKTQILGKYDIWLAHWTGSPSIPTKYNYGQTMWQWGIDKSLGIAGGVDGDRVYVDYPEKIRKLGLNFLSQAKPKAEIIQTAFYSYGNAAMRSEPTKQAQAIKRCEKGKLYPISETSSINGSLWLRHADNGSWSMERDGSILFKAYKPYNDYITLAKLNVRSQANTNNDPIGVLEKGSIIHVLERGKDWSKIIYDGVERYVSSTYIKPM